MKIDKLFRNAPLGTLYRCKETGEIARLRRKTDPKTFKGTRYLKVLSSNEYIFKTNKTWTEQ